MEVLTPAGEVIAAIAGTKEMWLLAFWRLSQYTPYPYATLIARLAYRYFFRPLPSAIFNRMSTFAVILPAAGQSRRFHDKAYKKPFAPLGGRAVWLHSAERFMNRVDVKQVIVCISAGGSRVVQHEVRREYRDPGSRSGRRRRTSNGHRAAALGARERATSISSPFTMRPGLASPTPGSTRYSPPQSATAQQSWRHRSKPP